MAWCWAMRLGNNDWLFAGEDCAGRRPSWQQTIFHVSVAVWISPFCLFWPPFPLYLKGLCALQTVLQTLSSPQNFTEQNSPTLSRPWLWHMERCLSSGDSKVNAEKWKTFDERPHCTFEITIPCSVRFLVYVWLRASLFRLVNGIANYVLNQCPLFPNKQFPGLCLLRKQLPLLGKPFQLHACLDLHACTVT